jgi:hypothetical protein
MGTLDEVSIEQIKQVIVPFGTNRGMPAYEVRTTTADDVNKVVYSDLPTYIRRYLQKVHIYRLPILILFTKGKGVDPLASQAIRDAINQLAYNALNFTMQVITNGKHQFKCEHKQVWITVVPAWENQYMITPCLTPNELVYSVDDNLTRNDIAQVGYPVWLTPVHSTYYDKAFELVTSMKNIRLEACVSPCFGTCVSSCLYDL